VAAARRHVEVPGFAFSSTTHRAWPGASGTLVDVAVEVAAVEVVDTGAVVVVVREAAASAWDRSGRAWKTLVVTESDPITTA
jgi:hypothetical protein